MSKLLLAMLMATVAMAKPMPMPQDPAPPAGMTFTLKNFELKALGAAGPGQSRIAFDLSTSDGTTTDLHCENLQKEDGTGRIIPFEDVTCDPFTYSIDGSAAKGFTLEISGPSGAGSAELASTDFTVLTEPTISYEVYQGSTDVTATAAAAAPTK